MENIEVGIRIRPINITEISCNDLEIWDSLAPQTIGISNEKYNELLRFRKIVPGQKTSFNFNYCYNQQVSNQQIYDHSIKRIALSSLQGINGTVFMYGQTGSGKTFTILGNKFNSLKEKTPSITENAHKKPPIPPTHELLFQERTPIHNPNIRSLKTPNKMNSASNIANVQIDLNSLMSESEKFEVESEKGLKREQYPQSMFENSEANPLKRQTHECLFNTTEDENVDGILGLALKDLFSEMEVQEDKKFFIRCSYLEIYTDIVYDLLKPQDKLSETLTIAEDLNKDFYVKGATDEIVTCVEDALFILKRGEANRHYASTTMNHSSSRSHTIFRLFLQCIPSKTQDIITESVLNFVDLAGSEKVSIHDHYFKRTRDKSAGHYTSSPSSSGNSNSIFKDRVNESKHINKSLFFLTQVISLKSQGKPEIHIPFRNSPLTKILRSSLGGNSRTAIILCVNPCFSQYEQTLSTIRFGLNAKKIENNIHRNIITSNNDEIIKNLIHDYEKKITDMEKEKTEDRSRSQNLLSVIEKLQEQKNLIEERLLIAKKAECFNEKTRANEVLKVHKLRNQLGDYIHLKNIGVLHVNGYSEQPKKELKFDSQGQFALEALRILQEKEKILGEKLDFSERDLNSLQDKYKSLITKYNTLETKLTKKRRKVDELSKCFENTSQENRLLNQFFELFESKSAEVLSRMSIDFLKNLEIQAQSLLEGIKFEKYMRNISAALQTSDKYQEFLRTSKGNLHDLMAVCRDTREKTQEINIKTEFLKEIGLKTVMIEEKDCQRASISSNFKDLLSQIKINTSTEQQQQKPGSIQSFQTYFEQEQQSSKVEEDQPQNQENQLNNVEEEPFESKLAELQKNFNEIKEKIKEKSFCGGREREETYSNYTTEIEKNRESLNENSPRYRNTYKENSPRRNIYPQNKENVNLSRREFVKNPRKPNENSNYKTSTNKKATQAYPFERHLEVLKSSNKN